MKLKKGLPYSFNSFGWISTPALRDLLIKWKNERGYHLWKNPGKTPH